MTWATARQLLVDRALVTSAADRPTDAGRALSGIVYDSRHVTAGALFVALKGQQTDGARFVQDAISRGASGIVCEEPLSSDLSVPWIAVTDARLAMALLAASYYGHPSTVLQAIGITGTNGKTTTAHLVASILEAAGLRCGLLGTVSYRVGTRVREATHTTPEAPDVQALLREMVDDGCRACVMEVSSHALALRRVDGMHFSAGVFTNLTRDHLDFHGDMETYFRAKRRLFEMLPPEAPALINLDDPRGEALCQAGGRPVTYAVGRPADVTPGPITLTLTGLAFDVRTSRGTVSVRSSLVGRPNVSNILAAVGVAVALGIPFDAIEKGIAALEGVPGRFQVVTEPVDPFTVVVDYAHTDDALRNLLETARPLTRGRVITVFGCGGDRDRTKRTLMGAVAGRLSDVIVITSDNPRSEDPARIIDEVRRGITPDTRRPGAEPPVAIVDRRAAIEHAVAVARPGDVVLVAGKGHEKVQVTGGHTEPFDDVVVAQQALTRRRSGSGVV